MKKLLVLLVFLGTILLFASCNRNEIEDNFVLLTEQNLKDHTGTIEIKFAVPSGVIYTNLEPLIKKFETLWENKIKVDFIKISEGYAGLRKQTILDLHNKKSVDLLIGYPDHFAEYHYGEGLLNLQPYIDNEGNNFMDDFIESYLPENKIADNSNDYYSLPLNKSTEVLIYNKTVFDAMGYDIPETWDEVWELSRQINKDVKDKKIDDRAISKLAETATKPSDFLEKGLFIPISYDSGSNAFITMTRQIGGAFTEKVSLSKGYAVFDNAKVKEGLVMFQNAAKEGLFSVPENFEKSYASEPFQNLQCLMTIGSSAGIGYNVPTGADPFEIGIAPLPYISDSKKFVIQQGTNIGILNQNTNLKRAAAWQLIKFLTNTENTIDFAINAGGYFPVRKSGLNSSKYQEFLLNTATQRQAKTKEGLPATDENGNPVMEANTTYYYSRAASTGLAYTDEGYTLYTDPFFDGSASIREAVESLFITIVVNNKNADIQRSINDTLNTIGPKYKKK